MGGNGAALVIMTWSYWPTREPSVASPFEHAEQLHLTEFEAVQEEVSRILSPHELSLMRHDIGLDAWIWSDILRDISLNEITFGTPSRTIPTDSAACFVIVFPVVGSSIVQRGDETVYATGDRPAVLSLREPDSTSMWWSRDCAQRVVRIPSSVLEAHLRDMLGHSLPRPLQLGLSLDASSGHGKVLAEDIAVLVERLERDRAVYESPLAVRVAEEGLMTRLLLAVRHNYHDMLLQEPDVRSSRIVQATVELIHAHPDWDHTLGSLAREQMVSTRTLGRQFKRDKGIGPIAYLKRVRLDRVRDILRDARPDATTVGHIAQIMGFANRAHFAAEYKQRHGELPSETLRR